MAPSTYIELMKLIDSLPVISSHEHILPDTQQAGMTLDRLLECSYVTMLDTQVGHTTAEHSQFLSQCRYNSLFVWLEKSLQAIYELEEPIHPGNWEDISDRIAKRHASTAAHIEILRDQARYRRAVQDAYWAYASNNGHPEMFSVTMRTDMFISSFHPDVHDHDGNSPFSHYPDIPTDDFRSYLDYIESLFSGWREAGAVAMKSASAYERTLDFQQVEQSTAGRVFCRKPESIGARERKAYGDFMFNWFCLLARKLDVPFQVHTGLARLSGSDPLLLEPAIARHPETRFVLFHVGYPWYDSALGLSQQYANLIMDLVWVPLVSTSGAIAALREMVEVVKSMDRICWGGDARTAEEALGALLAWRHVVAKVLAEKVDDGYMHYRQAETLAHKLMYQNVATLYGLAR
jgi:hypothetical protein